MRIFTPKEVAFRAGNKYLGVVAGTRCIAW